MAEIWTEMAELYAQIWEKIQNNPPDGSEECRWGRGCFVLALRQENPGR